jgi:hypothetical protein
MINAWDRESDAAVHADPAVLPPSAPAPLPMPLMLRFGGNRAVAALLSGPTADPLRPTTRSRPAPGHPSSPVVPRRHRARSRTPPSTRRAAPTTHR